MAHAGDGVSPQSLGEAGRSSDDEMPTTLTYELPKAEFDTFLHETFGIEDNELSHADEGRTL